MQTVTIQKLRGNFIISATLVTILLVSILVPYSFFLGWNIFTSILFWVILVPVISTVSARFYTNPEKRLLVGIVGCVFFYLIMIFMIYSHYESDLFKIMILSSFSSIFMIWFLNKIFTLKEFT